VNVCVFVEGGGPQRRTQTACRKAFHLFFDKLLGDRPKPRIIPSGSRDETYRDFCRALANDPGTFPFLLVDSEDPVPAGKTSRAHLRDRDHWTEVMPDDQVHLMVQCMEAWFLADIPAVLQYYEHEFDEVALRGNPNIEAIPKRDVMDRLHNATRTTSKGPYHKTRHGFEILGCIDPGNVRDDHLMLMLYSQSFSQADLIPGPVQHRPPF
jgi:hypothetical protein